MLNVDNIFRAYVACALWASTDDDGEPLDLHTVENEADMLADVVDFVEANEGILRESGLSDEQIGHDFWLTRNGHGAGFWDRGLGDVGRKLSDAAEFYGSADLYIGDDGLVYFGG